MSMDVFFPFLSRQGLTTAIQKPTSSSFPARLHQNQPTTTPNKSKTTKRPLSSLTTCYGSLTREAIDTAPKKQPFSLFCLFLLRLALVRSFKLRLTGANPVATQSPSPSP
uniref:Uncharacterized protein n=1 Tax=Solanum tuberosum TaxID=4113 RepID=M1A2M7_SOLTU